MTNLETFKQMYDNCEIISLEDEDGIVCAPCDIEKFCDSSYGSSGLILSLLDFQLTVSPENIKQGSFREDGTFDCTAELSYYNEKKTSSILLEIKFKQLQVMKPSDLVKTTPTT